MARPRKSERAIESMVIRLNQDDYNVLNNYAYLLDTTMSSMVIKVLLENKCFEYDVSDDIYFKMLEFPEARQIVPRGHCDTKTIRCRMTKNQKKSLTYCALTKYNISPLVLINDLIKKFLLDIKQEPENIENKADILIKDLWAKVSDKTKKELVDEYLQNGK